MEIYWLGHGCFRLKGREATVLTDPAPPSTGYKIGKVAADVVTVSRDVPESNYREAVQGEPKFVTSPGEYEIAGVMLSGIATRKLSDERGRNVAYVIEIDDIRICHLGDIQQVPTGDEGEQLSSPDVLLLPVGGPPVLNAEKAAEIVSLLEPKIVIPMLYKTEASAAQFEPVDRFLKEMGLEPKPPESRLNVTKSTVPSDTTVVLLNYRG
ncbi:MAG TPA: MBL fold metallo-hydrolase [Candidatus Limnocylindria bacterium]|nr:MBL fold metallo-hydrolase [Candidatus Limnocylindria bacterium]